MTGRGSYDKQTAYKELSAKAMAYICQRPGLTTDRLCVCLGWSPFRVEPDRSGKARLKRNSRIAPLLNRMVAEGLIRVDRDQYATEKELARVFPVDWQPQPMRPYQPQPVTVSYLEGCKLTTD